MINLDVCQIRQNEHYLRKLQNIIHDPRRSLEKVWTEAKTIYNVAMAATARVAGSGREGHVAASAPQRGDGGGGGGHGHQSGHGGYTDSSRSHGRSSHHGGNGGCDFTLLVFMLGLCTASGRRRSTNNDPNAGHRPHTDRCRAAKEEKAA